MSGDEAIVMFLAKHPTYTYATMMAEPEFVIAGLMELDRPE